MKITKLELTDFKCFDHLSLDNLGDRVVIVGPNGSGKSTILEAIVAAKEYLGGYQHPNTYLRQLPNRGSVPAWDASQALPIRANQQKATITLELSLNEAEQARCNNQSTVRVGVDILRNGEIIANGDSAVRTLFQTHDADSGVGIVDYLPSNRIYRSQLLTNIDRGQLNEERQRSERIESVSSAFTSNKFASTKQFIISEQLNDLSAKNDGVEGQDSLLELKKLFKLFFSPKELVGYYQGDGILNVRVRTPSGPHDIDYLSSGEKELFNVFVNLFRIRHFPGVILYDEPEAHLNAGLESRLMTAFDGLAMDKQVWIATHSSELIGTVEMNQIIALRPKGSSIEALRFTSDSKNDRYEIFESLGVRIGLQLAANSIVFLEGRDAHGDKRILDRLIGGRLPGVLFVASGASCDVLGAGTRAGLLLEEASKDASFLMLIDRDFMDDVKVEQLSKKLNNRVYIWKCHEVENLLLDADCIFRVLQDNDAISKLTDTKAVLAALRVCAIEKRDEFAVMCASYRLHSSIDLKVGKMRDEAAYFGMVKGYHERADSVYSEGHARELLNGVKAEIETMIQDGTWVNRLPGKEILNAFRLLYLPGVAIDSFQSQIVSAMLVSDRIPAEVLDAVHFIHSA